MFGVLPWPNDIRLFLVGNLYMAWWCLSLALIIAARSEHTVRLSKHVWTPISYMYFPIGGFMYMAVWLPKGLREGALTILPCLRAYEMIRAGRFGDQVETFYDFGYSTGFLAVLTLIGLWLVGNVCRHLELEW
jgi:capsular polysaccharide transport system permease protein